MANRVIEIIERYLELEIIKNKEGYSDSLRLKYDGDAKYYLTKGKSTEEALRADTIISFWTLYKRLLEVEVKWKAYKTEKSLKSLLRQMNSKRSNEYTSGILGINERMERFAEIVYTKGNYMLLPARKMNRARYRVAEDRIDLTLKQSFDGGKLSSYFGSDVALQKWVERECLGIMFENENIKADNILWLVDNEKLISEMGANEIYRYIEKAQTFICDREKLL